MARLSLSAISRKSACFALLAGFLAAGSVCAEGAPSMSSGPTAATSSAGDTSALGKPKAWIGISLKPPASDDAARVHAAGLNGVCAHVGMVFAGSAAESAGLAPDDLVCAIDGHLISGPQSLVDIISHYDVGSSIRVEVVHNRKRLLKKMTLSPRPEDGEAYLRNVLLNKPAPALAMGTWIDGKKRPLPGFNGKVTLLDFWEPWCGPCRETIPWLNEVAAKYANQGLQIVSIATDDEASIKKIATKITYPVLWDPKGLNSQKYMVMAIPTLLIVDRAGILREVSIGGGHGSALEGQLTKYLNEKSR